MALWFFSAVKAQEFLKLDKTQIIARMVTIGGVLKKSDTSTRLPGLPFPLRKRHANEDFLYFRFDDFKAKPNGFGSTSFFLRDNKCICYIISYYDDYQLDQYLKEFDNKNSNFGKVEKFMWVNYFKRYEVEIVINKNDVKKAKSCGYMVMYRPLTNSNIY